MNESDFDFKSNSGAELVDAIGRADREDQRSLKPYVAKLLDHEDPTVREEAIGLLAIRWRDRDVRSRLITILRSDSDEGVRSTAALALVSISEAQDRKSDIGLWIDILRNEKEALSVRRTSYEALLIQAGRTDFPKKIRDFSIERDVDWPWIAELGTL